MQSERPDERSKALVWVICGLVSAYFLEMLLIQFGAGRFVSQNVVLAAQNLREYKIWTLFTYSLLHDPSNLLHILFSVMGIYFLGRDLLPLLGNKRFWILYVVTALAGGLFWQALHWNDLGSLVGASAIVSGFFVLYACLYPDRPITILLLFIPVTLPKTKYVAYGLVLFDLAGLAFFELPGRNNVIGHSAHLGGMLAGYLFYQATLSSRSWRFTLPWSRHSQEVIPPKWVERQVQRSSTVPAIQLNLSEREQLKLEVDRILDKINSKGFGSLTPEEKKTLDDARDMLSKH